MTRLVTDDDIGLKVVRQAPAEAIKLVDIVAIHGMGAHPNDTWCKTIGSPDNPQCINWLENEGMLPAVVPNARIMRYGYDSDFFQGGSIKEEVSALATRLLRALRRNRTGAPLRPLFFIAHCVGGLIVMKALLDSKNSKDGLSDIFTATAGITFLGTPFRGEQGRSHLETITAIREKYPDDDELMDDMQTVIQRELENEFLEDLIGRFNNTKKQSRINITCFYARNVGGKSSQMKALVINGNTGCLDPLASASNFQLFRTQCAITKFGKPTEEDFEMVADAIKDMIAASYRNGLVSTQPQPQSQQPAPESSSNESSNPKNNSQNGPSTDHCCNFRVRGIPCGYLTRADVRELVKTTLSMDPGLSVAVHSLAINPIDGNSKIATLSFHSIPACFSENSRNEWIFRIPTDETAENHLSQCASLIFDTHFAGFTPFQRTEDDTCCVDIIAVTGLGGHAFGSFKERQGTFMWLRDALPLDFPHARILTYGYDSRVVNSDSFQNLADLGRSLHTDIKSIRGSIQSRSIVFIGHSLGGLVIKEAIVSLREEMDGIDASILNCTSGILFFGVPHQGMAISSLIPLIQNNPNRSLVESLGGNSALLHRLDKDFTNAFGKTCPRIISFFETKESPTALKVNGKWELSGRPEVLVDRASAAHGCKHPQPLNRNHSELVKFTNVHDELYIRVRLALLPFAGGQNSNPAAGGMMNEQNTLIQLSDSNFECLRSLAFREQENRYNSIYSAKDTSTCEWLLHDSQYLNWQRSPRGLFWIKGNPGAGKSVLMKFAAAIMMCKGSEDLVSSFFFNGGGAPLQKTPLGLFRAVLHSTLRFFPDHLAELTRRFVYRQNFYGNYQEDRWSWDEGELENFLTEVLIKGSKKQPLVIFVDALDECGTKPARRLLTYFKNLIESAEKENSRLKLCFSSRHYPILGFIHVPTLSVEERNDRDIRFVVQKRLIVIKSEETRQKIEKAVLLKAQGGFQWVELVISNLVDASINGINPETLHEKLESIPEHLDELYTKIIDSIPESEKYQMLKLFQWVLYSERPLSTQELRDALATDKTMDYNSVTEMRKHQSWNNDLTDFERHVKHISQGLVEFQTRDIWERYHGKDWDREAHFIHQSIADYLLKKFLRDNTHSCQGPSPFPVASGHFQISRSCLRYLALQEVLEGVSLDRGIFLSSFPLVLYATRFVFCHIRKVEEEGISQPDLLELFQWDHVSQSLGRIANFWKNLNTSHTPRGWPYTGATSLHVLISLGSKSALDLALLPPQDGLRHIGCRDRHGNTAFLFAIKECQQEMALALLPKVAEIDLNTTDNEGRAPISWATENGQGTLTRRLLSTGKVDPNSKAEDGQTPLFGAAANGHNALVQLLLQTNMIDPDASDDSWRTPLSWAARGGHADTVKMLLETGKVCIDSKDKFGQTPFFYAASSGSESVVKLLIETGEVDVESENIANQRPLLWASRNGHIGVVKLLIETGKVNIHSEDKSKLTALFWAAKLGHDAIVKLLIETERAQIPLSWIHINLRDTDQMTPLFWAVRNGHETVVKLLLETGKASVNLGDGVQTPLSWASKNGHETMVKLLLTIGRANIGLGDNGQTPLSWASRNGHTGVVKLILDTNRANVGILDNNKRTPLSWAAESGHDSIVKLLLDKSTASINTGNNKRRTPLSWAAENGHEITVKHLLDTNKAAVNKVDDSGRTPIFWAIQNGHCAVVKLLIATGQINMELKYDGRTPFIYAAMSENASVLEPFLNASNIDFDERIDGMPLLIWAIKSGRVDLVQLLIGIGQSSLYTVDASGIPALFWAVEHGNVTIVNLLLATGNAGVDLSPPNGATPLMLAVEKGNLDMAKQLLDIGKADVNKKDTHNLTALSHAAEAGYPDLITCLLERGADIHSVDNSGCSPLTWAVIKGHSTAGRLLIERGAPSDRAPTPGETLIGWAAGMGFYPGVQLLLDVAKVDPNVQDQSGWTPLAYATANGHFTIVKTLLQTNKANVNLADRFGSTPLCKASTIGHSEIVELLLREKEIDVNFEDPYGCTALALAAAQGHTLIASLLIERGKADADQSNQHGWSPLFTAASKGHVEIVNVLLTTKRVDVNRRDHQGSTPLIRAAEQGHFYVVSSLLASNEVEVNVTDVFGSSPLLRAAANGHLLIVDLLLKTDNVDPDLADYTGCTPLIRAVELGSLDIVRRILKTGKVKVDVFDQRGRNALCCAMMYGHFDIADALIVTGRATIDLAARYSWTPFSWAAALGKIIPIAILLTGNKANVNYPDGYGRTPLSWAAGNGHKFIVWHLCRDSRVQIDVEDEWGWTPLLEAASNGHAHVVSQLLETQKVKIDRRDHQGQTALSQAAEKGHTEVFKILLCTWTVDLNVQDSYGFTPLIAAAANGHRVIVELLLESGQVEVDKEDYNGKTALAWAEQSGEDYIADLLRQVHLCSSGESEDSDY